MLTGKVAIVTGANQGLGLAICRAFLDANAQVSALDKNPRSNSPQSMAGEQSDAMIHVRCDVSSERQCRDAVCHTLDRFGRIDILVNCAGILIRDRLDSETALAGYDKTMQVNVRGIVNMVRGALPGLERSSGVILNLASIQSFVALPNSFAYNASKGAVLQLTKALAGELAPSGIRVNGIAPGWMETPMNDVDAGDVQAVDAFLSRVPLKRLGKSEDVGGPAIFLCSDMSRYVTGATLPVDGGFLAV